MQVRSSGRTPNGSMLSHPDLISGLPKIRAKSTSSSGSSNKAKSGKLLPVRALTAIQIPNVDVKQNSSTVKSRPKAPLFYLQGRIYSGGTSPRNPQQKPLLCITNFYALRTCYFSWREKKNRNFILSDSAKTSLFTKSGILPIDDIENRNFYIYDTTWIAKPIPNSMDKHASPFTSINTSKSCTW